MDTSQVRSSDQDERTDDYLLALALQSAIHLSWKTAANSPSTPWRPHIKRRPIGFLDMALEIRRLIYYNTIDVFATNCPRAYSNLNAFPSRLEGQRPPQTLACNIETGRTPRTARCRTPGILRTNRQIHHEYIEEVFRHFAVQLYISDCPTNEVYCQLPRSSHHQHSIPPMVSFPPIAVGFLRNVVLTFSLESSASASPRLRSRMTEKEVDWELSNHYFSHHKTYLKHAKALKGLKNLQKLDIIVKLGPYPAKLRIPARHIYATYAGLMFCPIWDYTSCPEDKITVYINFADGWQSMSAKVRAFSFWNRPTLDLLYIFLWEGRMRRFRAKKRRRPMELFFKIDIAGIWGLFDHNDCLESGYICDTCHEHEHVHLRRFTSAEPLQQLMQPMHWNNSQMLWPPNWLGPVGWLMVLTIVVFISMCTMLWIPNWLGPIGVLMVLTIAAPIAICTILWTANWLGSDGVLMVLIFVAFITICRIFSAHLSA